MPNYFILLTFACMISCTTEVKKTKKIVDSLQENKTSNLENKIEGFVEGKLLYDSKCSSCHQKNGAPEVNIYPPLKGSDFLVNNQDKIACIIRNGLEEPLIVNGKKYGIQMPGFSALTAQEISQIIVYINNAWGNNYGISTVDKVKKELEGCQ